MLGAARSPTHMSYRRRVLIATPCGDTVGAAYAGSMFSMLLRTFSELPGNLEELSPRLYTTSILPHSRMFLANEAVKGGYTHILFIDSDMGFSDDLLLRLLQRNEPIIGANCVSRRAPYRYTAQSAPGVAVVTDEKSIGIEKVMRVGTGLLWVHTDVFKAMKKPWFHFEWAGDESEDQFLGEDYYFCKKAQEAGFPIVIDHDLSKGVEHWGLFAFTPLRASKAAEMAGIDI